MIFLDIITKLLLSETLESRFRRQLAEYVQLLRDTFTPELEITLAQEKTLLSVAEQLRKLQDRGVELKSKIVGD